MSQRFLQKFLISVFSSVISPLGVGVNFRPYLIKVSFALLPIALFVSIKSFGLTGSFDAKSLEFGSCLGTKRVTSLHISSIIRIPVSLVLLVRIECSFTVYRACLFLVFPWVYALRDGMVLVLL